MPQSIEVFFFEIDFETFISKKDMPIKRPY